MKKDNIREQYDRSKIEGGVLRACHKRPISADQIAKLVDEVEVEIFNREEKEKGLFEKMMAQTLDDENGNV